MSGTPEPIRLLAQSVEDLPLISALVQDGVGAMGHVQYLAKKARFSMLIERFVWEDGGRKNGLRVSSALAFESVLSVASNNVRTERPDGFFAILAVIFTPNDEILGADGGGTIDINLSGGGAFRLKVECLDVLLADVSDARPAQSKPSHQLN